MTGQLRGEARRRVAADFAKRYRAGATVQQIADATGRSYTGVHNLLVVANVEFRRGSGLDSAARAAFVADVVDRYQAGDSIRAIAAVKKRSYTAVRDILVAQRVPLRPRGFEQVQR